MDSFQDYLKKQLLDYVEQERRKGIPIETIEKVLLDAGHEKNIIDEVMAELRKELSGKHIPHSSDPIENDFVVKLKETFSKFMASSSKEEIRESKKIDTKQIVRTVIKEAEIIEEKRHLESFGFFVYLIILGVLVVLTAANSGSGIVSVFLGFSPALINAFISMVTIGFADAAPLYVFIPLIITSIFYVAGRFIGLFAGMDLESLAVVNFLLGLGFNVMIIYIRFVKPKSLQRRVVNNQNRQKAELDELRELAE